MKRWNSRPEGMRLTSSMQPISISRSPPWWIEAGRLGVENDFAHTVLPQDSRRPVKCPVARVGLAAAPAQRGDRGVQRGLARLDVDARVHNEIGRARASRHPASGGRAADRAFPPTSPAAPACRARCTSGGGADDDVDVDQLVGAGLEQQRDLEHRDLGAARGVARAGTRARPRAPADARSLRARESVAGLRQQHRAQLGAIDAAVRRRAGECAARPSSTAFPPA